VRPEVVRCELVLHQRLGGVRAGERFGTHRGEFMGLPASGKAFSIKNAETLQFTGLGLIAEH